MYDIIIIGAGTAGMSAGIYGIRAGKKVLIIEEKSFGGQIVNATSIENYPGITEISGFDFSYGLYNQLKGLGGEVVTESVSKIIDGQTKEVITNKNKYQSSTVIIATGAKNRKLNLKNEDELIGKGISYCATCDGMFFRGKDVAVVGGGNTALEDATFLSQYCNKVYVIHRRDEFRGEELLASKLEKKDNVQFVLNSTVEELIGKEQLEKIIVKDKITNKETELNVQGVFVAIGQAPDNERFSDVVTIDKKGYVVAGEDCKTSAEGIFVAGDCRTKKVRQLTTAAADGATAALMASEYLV